MRPEDTSIDDIEARLRAAYAQTADLRWTAAEGTPTGLELPAVVDRPGRRWLVPGLAAVLIVSLGAGSYLLGHHPRPAPATVARPSGNSIATASSAGRPVPSTSAVRPLASGANPVIGVRYRYQWLIHCQTGYAEFGGQLWRSLTPVPSSALARPLPGGGAEYTGYLYGTMRLTGLNTAEFSADPASVPTPLTVRFVAAAAGTPPIPICA